ncbi:GDSL-type esterase/lipase family protein [Streptomyces sp. NPDC052610]|uniref:GDSL-type esterase/lipase family protein n=1 Tax=Streptomyces sp. NPDC052610 TaxID=3154952 RepID=UPI0034469B86
MISKDVPRRLLAALMALLTTAATVVAVGLDASTAHAAPLRSTPLITWNMRGATWDAHSKWTEVVGPFIEVAEVVALQEAGARPPGDPVRQIPHNAAPAGAPAGSPAGFVQHNRWRYGYADYEVYFLQTDRNADPVTGNPTYDGGRVNIAIVTHRQADEVRVVANPGGRAALGVRFGDDWYFTFHGQSEGGRINDSGPMAVAVANSVAANNIPGRNWTILGDFNLEPIQWFRPGVHQYASGEPTQHGADGNRELDYAVSSHDYQQHPVNRIEVPRHVSDHDAVSVGTLRAAADPADLRLLPVGDSITYGENSTTLNGYRDPLWDYLAMSSETLWARDFVGSQRSGNMRDPDHEGHPGARIDEIMGEARCSVPAHRPNVVTLHAGTNDMNQQYQLATAPDRLGRLIDQILADAPEAVVLVATLIPSSKAGMQPRIDAYNARVPEVVRARQAQGKHVLLVDMSAVTTADVDGSHPDDTGYRKMAQAFHGGIVRAEQNGWITDPVPGSGQPCGDGETSKAGPGWRALGVIAPGMTSPEGRTDIVELNGDDRGDYVRITDDGAVRAALNTPAEPGRPDWADIDSGVPAAGPGSGAAVRFADVNGDGRDDLLELRSDSSVLAFENQGVEGGRIEWGLGRLIAPGVSGATREAIRFADVDGDGRDDYLRVGDSGAVHAYINTPDDSGLIHWEERLDWAPGVRYGSRDKLRLADVNGDRRADYLMVGSDGTVHAYLNDGGGGGGGFTEHLYFVYATGYPGQKSVFRDISGDGKADYLVVYDGGSLRAWLNRGGNLD